MYAIPLDEPLAKLPAADQESGTNQTRESPSGRGCFTHDQVIVSDLVCKEKVYQIPTDHGDVPYPDGFLSSSTESNAKEKDSKKIILEPNNSELDWSAELATTGSMKAS